MSGKICRAISTVTPNLEGDDGRSGCKRIRRITVQIVKYTWWYKTIKTLFVSYKRVKNRTIYFFAERTNLIFPLLRRRSKQGNKVKIQDTKFIHVIMKLFIDLLSLKLTCHYLYHNQLINHDLFIIYIYDVIKSMAQSKVVNQL